MTEPLYGTDIKVPPEMQQKIESLSFKVDEFVFIAPVPPATEVRRGICRFIGPTLFSEGLWVGIELVGSMGKNSGVVNGVHYFDTRPGRGVFVRHEIVTPVSKGDVANVAAAVAAAIAGLPKPGSPTGAAAPKLPVTAKSQSEAAGAAPAPPPADKKESTAAPTTTTTSNKDNKNNGAASNTGKTLSGKSELELLGEIEEWKDRVQKLQAEVRTAKEAQEATELDMELLKEEKLMLQDEIEEMKLKIVIAENGGGGGDDANSLMLLSLQRKAKATEEENVVLQCRLDEMKDHLKAVKDQESVIENLTDRNLELSEQLDSLRDSLQALRKENEDLKQLQFMQDEELQLQKEQADSFAAQLEEWQRVAASNNETTTASTMALQHKNTTLETEVSRLRNAIRESTLKQTHESSTKAHQLQVSMLAVTHLGKHLGTMNLCNANGVTTQQSAKTSASDYKGGTILVPVPRNGSGSGEYARAVLHQLTMAQPEQIAKILEDKHKQEEQQQKEAASETFSPRKKKTSAEAEAHKAVVHARAEALASTVSSLFATITDEVSVGELLSSVQQCLLCVTHCMRGLEECVSNIITGWSAAANSINNDNNKSQYSKTLVSAAEMTILDTATAMLLLSVEIQQLLCMLLQPAYRDRLTRYVSAKRDAIATEAALAGSVDDEDMLSSSSGTVFRYLRAVTRHVSLIVAGATLQHTLGAERNGIAAGQCYRRIQAVTAALARIQEELSPYFSGVTSSHSPIDSKAAGSSTTSTTRTGITEAMAEAAEYTGWWTVAPSTQAATALLLHTLTQAAQRGYEQVLRLVQGPALATIFAGSVDPTTSTTTDGAEPRTLFQTQLADYFTDTVALLHQASNLLKGNFSNVLSDDSNNDDGDNNKSKTKTSGDSGLTSLRIAPVESGLALFLLFRSLHQFSAALRRAEMDVEMGMSGTLAEALATRISQSQGKGDDTNNTSSSGKPDELTLAQGRLQVFIDATGSLEGMLGAAAAATDGDTTIEWNGSRSVTLGLVSTVPMSSSGATSSSGRAVGYLASPLVRTVCALVTGLAAGRMASGSGVDDLRHSSVATLASLFIHGGLRKDVSSYIASGGELVDGATTNNAVSVATVGSRGGEHLLRELTYHVHHYFGSVAGDDDTTSPSRKAGSSVSRDVLTQLEEQLALKEAECAELTGRVEELELQLYNVSSEQSVIQIVHRELDGAREALAEAEARHKTELEKQLKEWTEAYDRVNKTKTHLAQEVRMLKTEEKLSPLSAQERFQHQLLLSYYSALLAEVLVGGGLGAAGVGRYSSNLRQEIKQREARRSEADREAELAALLQQTVSPHVALPSLPVESLPSCSPARNLDGGDAIFGGAAFTRRSQSALSVADAARLLDIVHRREGSRQLAPQLQLATAMSPRPEEDAAEGGEESQPLSHVLNSTNTSAKSASSVAVAYAQSRAKQLQLESQQLYITKLPKIRRFTEKEECRRSRLGVLLGQ